MTGKRDRDVGERLNLPHEDGGSLRYGGAPGNRAIPDLVGLGIFHLSGNLHPSLMRTWVTPKTAPHQKLKTWEIPML